MKWVSAILRAIILFLSFGALYIMFTFVMQVEMTSWKNSNAALGAIPKAAISLQSFLMQHLLVVGVVVMVISLALAFIDTARKKAK